MSLRVVTDPAVVRRVASALVEDDPVRHTVFGTLAASVDAPDAAPWAALGRDRLLVAARSQCATPVALSRAWRAETGELPTLSDVLLRIEPPIAALAGPPEPVDVLTGRLDAAGRAPTRRMAERLHRLHRLEPPRGVAGRVRSATPQDAPLLVSWVTAFGLESFGDTAVGAAEQAAGMTARVLSGDGSFWIWDEDGTARSLAAARAPVCGVARIGPVYTPPEHRGRGYATALVADLSQRLLDEGRAFCFLYTDLANPTSNAIYERIGYVRVATSAMIGF